MSRPRTPHHLGRARRRLPRRLAVASAMVLAACSGVDEYLRAAESAAGSTTGRTVAELARSKDARKTAEQIVRSKRDQYVRDPAAVARDVRTLKAEYEGAIKFLSKHVEKEWGRDEVKLPERKRYVKYGPGYRSRSEVDYEEGTITVETLDADADAALREQTVSVLQTPADPEEVDIFSDRPVTPRPDETPVLSGVVVDGRTRRPVRTREEAEAYADGVVRSEKRTRKVKVDGVEKTASYVKVKLPPNFQNRLAENYRPIVLRFSERFQLDPTLVYAIIRTESNFNAYAVSSAPAYGLMQLVPTSGGRDGYRRAKGTDGVPTKEYLFDPENNIELGAAYLNVLTYQLLEPVAHLESREYCVISAYNTGPRNVYRSFARDDRAAVAAINALEPPRVFDHLRARLPYDETRQYLVKVTGFKKQFRDTAADAPPGS